MLTRIQYIERPVTDEERAIAALLEGIHQALRGADAAALASLFAKDARIMVRGRTDFITGDQYIAHMMRNAPRISRIEKHGLLIRAIDSRSAVASCENAVHFSDGAAQLRISLQYRFTKTDAGWRIVEITNG